MPPIENAERRVCFDHTGHEARIKTCEKNDVDIFTRLREVEIAVWKSAGATGVITAIVIVVIEKVILK